MLGTIDDFDAWEMSFGVVAHHVAVGVDHDLRHVRALLQLQDHLVIQRLAGKHPVILPRHPPALMTHRNNGADRWSHRDVSVIGMERPITGEKRPRNRDDAKENAKTRETKAAFATYFALSRFRGL